MDASSFTSSYRPVIGIPADHVVETEITSRSRWQLNDTYVSAIYDAGGLPLILPRLPEVADQLLELLDGLVLSGGGDIDPVHYGTEQHPLTAGISPERDDLELRAFAAARERDLPILGICRGVQLVNVAMGGTLVQDIPDQRPGTSQHRQDFDGLGRDDVSHRVTLDPDSQLAGIYGGSEIQTNSYHHQALERIADGLVVTGRADDGTIESVEAPDGPFLVAVQWHPETLYLRHTDHALIFRAFVAAAAAEHANHSSGLVATR